MRGRRLPPAEPPGTGWGASLLEELFYVLGFGTNSTYPQYLPEDEGGVPMSRPLYELRPKSGLESVTWFDIDALRCVFPEGG